jgi:hypothetical protein
LTDVSEILTAFIIIVIIITALMTEAANTYETSVNFYQTARRSISEGSQLQHKRNCTSDTGNWLTVFGCLTTWCI